MSRPPNPSVSGSLPVVHAVFLNGVFHPRELVDLPEGTEVEFAPRLILMESTRLHRDRVHALLSRSIVTGEADMAERHNEPPT